MTTIMTKEEFERLFRMYFNECHGTNFVATFTKGGYRLSILLDDGTQVPVNKICNAGKSLATVLFMGNAQEADFEQLEIHIE